jgi:hypothetical protein
VSTVVKTLFEAREIQQKGKWAKIFALMELTFLRNRINK